MTRLCACLLAALVSFACTATEEPLSVSSPDGQLTVHFALDDGARTS